MYRLLFIALSVAACVRMRKFPRHKWRGYTAETPELLSEMAWGLTVARAGGQARGMSSESVVAKKKLPLLKIIAGLVVLGVVALFFLRGVNVRELIEQMMTLIRDAGPVAYFTAMALLPAVGMPASVFTLTAGPVFGPKLGMPWVVFLCVAAIMFNIVLTYFLARRALRPVLEKLMARFGYKLPQVAPEDMTDLAIIVRVTPGSPFPVQNYLLGLANVPFGPYLLVSFIVQVIYTPAFVLFGDALLHGKGKLAMIAVGLLAAAAVAAHWARKHYGKKNVARK